MFSNYEITIKYIITMIKSIVPIKPEVEVRVIECGPLRLGGHVRIVFPDGSMIIKQRAFICRCGKSKNQPFCDGSHSEQIYGGEPGIFYI